MPHNLQLHWQACGLRFKLHHGVCVCVMHSSSVCQLMLRQIAPCSPTNRVCFTQPVTSFNASGPQHNLCADARQAMTRFMYSTNKLICFEPYLITNFVPVGATVRQACTANVSQAKYHWYCTVSSSERVRPQSCVSDQGKPNQTTQQLHGTWPRPGTMNPGYGYHRHAAAHSGSRNK